MIGAGIGVGKQIITDFAVSIINKEVKISSWARYVGSVVGGTVGVWTGLIFSPFVSGAAGSASATFTENVIENIFGRKSYSGAEVAKATIIDGIYGGAFAYVGEKVKSLELIKKHKKTPIVGDVLTKVDRKFASYKAQITKWERKQIKNIYKNTIINGFIYEIYSDGIETSIEMVGKSAYDNIKSSIREQENRAKVGKTITQSPQ